jgi:hypothetical protein
MIARLGSKNLLGLASADGTRLELKPEQDFYPQRFSAIACKEKQVGLEVGDSDRVVEGNRARRGLGRAECHTQGKNQEKKQPLTIATTILEVASDGGVSPQSSGPHCLERRVSST